jgi:thioredoxin 1
MDVHAETTHSKERTMKPVAVTEAQFPREVLLSDEPVAVDFFAEWCGPCKALAPMLEKLSDQYAGRVKVVKVDIDQEPGLATRFGIRGVPTMIFFRNGKAVDQVVGLLPPASLAAKFEGLATAVPA